MSYDNLPPGTTDHDHDAPWNQEDDDGAAEAFGIAAVTGNNHESMLETFAEFIADCGEVEEKLLAESTWLREKPSNADLLKIILSDKGVVSANKVNAALAELRARYLAAPYTQRVIQIHADAWALEQAETAAEGA